MMASPIYKLLHATELVYIILDHIDNSLDILNFCLTSKICMAAGYTHLFQTINLPKIPVKARQRNTKNQFHKRYAEQLARYTRSIRIDGYTVAPEAISSIKPIHRQWRMQEQSHADLKHMLDRLYHGLEQILSCTPRLREFSSYNIPRSLDLLILIQRHCPNVESLEISPLKNDRQGLHMFDTSRFPTRRRYPASNRPEHEGCVFPLWNGVNMEQPPLPPPSVSPVRFDLPRLTCLSLAGIRYPCLHGDHFVRNLVSLLRGSPNLKCLALRGYTHGDQTSHMATQLPPFSSAYDSEPPGGWSPPFPDQMRHTLLHSICKTYYEQQKQLSGSATKVEPLKLRYLRLEVGAELTEDTSSMDGPSPDERRRPHYLASLTDLSYLEELHLDFKDERESSGPILRAADARPSSFFLWPNAIRLITDGHLPRLQKLSIPCTHGLAWGMLSKQIDREFAKRLTVSIQWTWDMRLVPLGEATEYSKHKDTLGDFHGLHMNFHNSANYWRSRIENPHVLPRELKHTRSLKTRIPTCTTGSSIVQDHLVTTSSPKILITHEDVINVLPIVAPELREIWIFNLKEDVFVANRDRYSSTASSSDDWEVKYRDVAGRIVERYDKLTYVRIDDTAWWICRTWAGSEKPEFLPVPYEAVDRDIPLSFSTAMPYR